MTNAAQLTQCCKAARHRLTHVSAHHQVGVDEDAQVAYTEDTGETVVESTVSVAVGSRF